MILINEKNPLPYIVRNIFYTYLSIPTIPPSCSEGLRPPIPIDCAWEFRANRSVATRVFQLLSVL